MNKANTNLKMKVKRGDTVMILLGKDRGKKGKIMAVLPDKGRVMVEGVNLVKKHVKARRSNEKGQRVDVAAPVHMSNVQLICTTCKKPARIGISREAGERHRVCKKCKAIIE